MSHAKIVGISFTSLLLLCCGSDNSTSVSEHQSANKVCIEGATATINDENYICKNDKFVPENQHPSSESKSSPDTSSSKNNSQQSSSSDNSSNNSDSTFAVGKSCQYNGEWHNYGDNDKIICLENVWKLQSEITDSYKSSSSVSSSSRNLSISTGEMTDSRDNKIYKTVTIGTQTWFAENLNYSDSIVTPNIKQVSGCYRDSIKYCEMYGRLYAWPAAMDLYYHDYINAKAADVTTYPHQGVCPSGWHIPTKEEWLVLADYLGDRDEKYSMYRNIGKGLKYTGTWYHVDLYDDTTFVEPGTNEYGFNALPAGTGNLAAWSSLGERTYFWTASEHTPTVDERYPSYHSATYFSLEYDDDLEFYEENKLYWHSIRCLKN